MVLWRLIQSNIGYIGNRDNQGNKVKLIKGRKHITKHKTCKAEVAHNKIICLQQADVENLIVEKSRTVTDLAAKWSP